MSITNSGLVLPEHTILLIKGTSKTLKLVVQDENCDPIDITGARVVFSVKETFDDEFPLIFKDSQDALEVVITTPKLGMADIYIKPEDTHNMLSTFDYVYDAWVIQASGDRFAVIPPSTFKVRDSVTRIPV